MKAIIFNSGLGSRLGALTSDRPKGLVALKNGETILHRQLRILTACGLRNFVITTGPFPEKIKAETTPFERLGATFTFVHNPRYSETNYLYSMYLARNFLRDDDIILLHGDLVFDPAYAQEVVDFAQGSLGSVNADLPLPEKDFKARIVNGRIDNVSVSLFDEGCVAFQPFYKLTRESASIWLDAVERFAENDKIDVYAENAANTVFCNMDVHAHSYTSHFVEEVDTPDDLERVSAAIRLFDFAEQPIFVGDGTSNIKQEGGAKTTSIAKAANVTDLLRSLGSTKPLIVASRRFASTIYHESLVRDGISFCQFSDFTPNPDFEEVAAAVKAYRAAQCDGILSFGGGSAIDVAKCVKMFADADRLDKETVKGPYTFQHIPHVAIPTTAGSGSESTRAAVIYIDNVKASVAHDCLVPDAAILDATLLATLPKRQRAATFMDALCQAIESHWSQRSCPESRTYSARAIRILRDNAVAYLNNDPDASRNVMRGSNLAGKAIAITSTTAPHAMSYGLTKRFDIPHGQAVALTLPTAWKFLEERGDKDTLKRLEEIADAFEEENSQQARRAFSSLYEKTGLAPHLNGTCEDAEKLAASVNADRLSNFPLALSGSDLQAIYQDILA